MGADVSKDETYEMDMHLAARRHVLGCYSNASLTDLAVGFRAAERDAARTQHPWAHARKMAFLRVIQARVRDRSLGTAA